MCIWVFVNSKIKLKLQQNITHSTSVMKKENKSCANNKRERHTIKKKSLTNSQVNFKDEWIILYNLNILRKRHKLKIATDSWFFTITFLRKKISLPPLPTFLHTMNRKYQCCHRKYWCYYYDHTTMNIEFSNTTVRCFTLSARFAQTQQPPLDATHSQNHFTPNSPIKIDLSSTCIKIMIFSLIFIFNNKNKM